MSYMKELTLSEVTEISQYRPAIGTSVAEVTAKRDAFWGRYHAELARPRSYGTVRMTLENAIERCNDWLAQA